MEWDWWKIGSPFSSPKRRDSGGAPVLVSEAVGGVGLVEDRLSILWSQEKRFR